MINFKFIGLFSVIFVFIVGGIYFGFLEFNGDKNFFSQISGVSGDDFQHVGEIELENDFINKNSNQKNINQNVVVKSAKKNKKTATSLNENVAVVVSGVAGATVIPATSTVAILMPTIVSSTPIILSQEQNQEQVIVSTSTPVVIVPPIVPDVPVAPDIPIVPVIQPNIANYILVSEIMAGMEGNINYEFIELFNPTSQSVDLTGWSIKKKSSTGSESTLVSSSRLGGKIIPPGKYFLLANEGGYGGQISPDVFWPKSYTLAYSNNSIIIYNANNELVEEVSWTEIPKGQSIERESFNGEQFKIQSTPNPQNSQSN